MWAKRFPLQEFNCEPLKGLDWVEPEYLGDEEIDRLVSTGKIGGGVEPMSSPVVASDEFFEKFNIIGKFRHAVLCRTPDSNIHLVGRSHAWKKQRLFIVDSLDPEQCNVLLDWNTSRPMSTRLGPKEGATITGGIWFAVFTHMISTNLVGNRTLLQKGKDGGELSILSSSEPEINDFHDCNLYIRW